ncbi:GNAT family N-acetyltransferase [Arcobacter sp. FWKO B]|uniref:GNAT family N-acetyltransferase n=1 Tax=Arcobacter sp. FWKO B TaxID=2593672 RepID=UPI0019058465|nr:GNAT family N-acetyltransferase [Arcobacter sp. FWKO B]
MQKAFIKKATYKEIPYIAELLVELFSIEKDFTIDKHRHINALKILLDEPLAIAIVAVIDEQIVGFASMQRVISTATGGYSGLIEDVIIKNDFRSHGIGNMLIDRLINEAKKLSYKRVQLLCDMSNHNAQQFYFKKSFVQSSMQGYYLTLP